MAVADEITRPPLDYVRRPSPIKMPEDKSITEMRASPSLPFEQVTLLTSSPTKKESPTS